MTTKKVTVRNVLMDDPARPYPDFYDRAYRKKRILEITCQMVESQVARGKVNPDDPEALKKAVKAAAKDAKAAYDAAVEYISG